jgi:hypothetical protein
MTASSEDYERWFIRTFKEREDALDAILGPSHPPQSPEGHVLSINKCGSGEHAVLIPGACLHLCPPVLASCEGGPRERPNWVYASVGLSQPADPDDKPRNGERGSNLSAHGVEFGMVVSEPAEWIGSFFAELMGYASAVSPIYIGHRFPFGLHRKGGKTSWFIGHPEELEVKAFGETRALIFWPYLGGPRWLTTGTGSFEFLCATAITGEEWEYAKQTSSPHLLVLLFEAGVGQLSRFDRTSLFAQTRFRRRAEDLASESREQVESTLWRLSAHHDS